jgi:hypothetical protein
LLSLLLDHCLSKVQTPNDVTLLAELALGNDSSDYAIQLEALLFTGGTWAQQQ